MAGSMRWPVFPASRILSMQLNIPVNKGKLVPRLAPFFEDACALLVPKVYVGPQLPCASVSRK